MAVRKAWSGAGADHWGWWWWGWSLTRVSRERAALPPGQTPPGHTAHLYSPPIHIHTHTHTFSHPTLPHRHNAGDASSGVSYARDCAVYAAYYRCGWRVCVGGGEGCVWGG